MCKESTLNLYKILLGFEKLNTNRLSIKRNIKISVNVLARIL